MNLIHSWSEIRTYRVFIGNKLDGIYSSLYYSIRLYTSPLNKKCHLTGATLQDDVIANFQFQRLTSYWQRLSQALQISIDRLCRLTASLQNENQKI